MAWKRNRWAWRPRKTPALAVGLAAALLWTAGRGQATLAREFTFEGLNRTYVAEHVRPAPVEWGPLRVRLASTRADLTLLGHRFRLSPVGDGTHWCEVTVEFEGGGPVSADVEGLGFATRQDDEVTLPPQRQTQRVRVRVIQGERGYLVTSVETPRQVRVALRSRLAGRLVDWCEGLPFVALLGGTCDGLGQALSSAVLPLPPPGETYLVPYEELSPEERRSLDRYLAQAGGG